LITVRTYETKDKQLWNDFVASAKNATFLFDRDFMEYHSNRFSDYSLLCFNEGKLVAILPANIVGNTLYSHQGLSYGGLLVNKKMSAKNYITVMKSVLFFLHNNKICDLQIKTIPSIYDDFFSEEEKMCIHLLEAKRLQVDSYYVIDNNFTYSPNRNRKRALKIAAENGLNVKEDTDLPVFWEEILSKNLQERFQVNPVHNLSEITDLQNKFPSKIRFYGAYNNSKLKAGVVMFVIDNVAHFQYSSGVEDRNDDAALDFLFDFIIKKYATKRYISFGSSSQNKGLEINTGLAYWKESFGARMHVQEHYKINTANYQHLNSVFV